MTTFVSMCFMLSFTSAIMLSFNESLFSNNFLSEEYVTDKMTNIHFADYWNDFGWLFYFSNNTGNTQAWTYYYVKTETWNVFECGEQVKWFYYNAQRGERLWPLDNETKSKFWQTSNLYMSWWIYTSCATSWYRQAVLNCETNTGMNYADCMNIVKSEFRLGGDWYYGAITYQYSWQEMNLTVWIEYDTGESSFITIKSESELKPTFVRIGGKYPVGFVYDYNGWVGLVWCRFKEEYLTGGSMKNLLNEVGAGGERIKEFFRYNSNNETIEYTGWNVTWVDCEPISQADTLLTVVIEWLVWVGKMIAFPEAERFSNSSDTKMQTFLTENINNGTMMNYAKKKAELLCRWKWQQDFQTASSNIICYNWNESTDLSVPKNKTLIVKQWDVVVKPGTWGNSDNGIYDILVLSGNLIIDEEGAEKYKINKNGFLSGQCGDDCFGTSVDLAGNIIWVASYLKWNFIVNWNLMGRGVSLSNKYFVYWKLITKDDFKSLSNLFSWKCVNGISTDNHACLKWPYQNAALVVIDQNYDSPLFR